MSRVIRPLLVAVAAFALQMVAAASPAHADEYGECYGPAGSGCVPDGVVHEYCLGSSTVGKVLVRASIATAMDIMERDTVMLSVQQDACTNARDVRWQEAGVSTGDLASYQCLAFRPSPRAGSPRQCTYSTIIINRAAHDNAQSRQGYGSDGRVEEGELALNLDVSACHELGHSLGFRHFEDLALTYYTTQQNDCQRSPWLEVEFANDGWRSYNNDHAGHINREY